MSKHHPVVQELDLGPIHIDGCTFSRRNSNGQYVLSLSVGPHEIDIEASPQGNSVVIFLNGERLGTTGYYQQ